MQTPLKAAGAERATPLSLQQQQQQQQGLGHGLSAGFSGGSSGWTPTPDAHGNMPAVAAQHIGQLRVEVAALHAELEVRRQDLTLQQQQLLLPHCWWCCCSPAFVH